MDKIQLVIADDMMDRAIEAFATVYRYSLTLPNGKPNSVSKVDFANAKVNEWLKNIIIEAEKRSMIAKLEAEIDFRLGLVKKEAAAEEGIKS